jgi:uncharacterized membrane protein YfcA
MDINFLWLALIVLVSYTTQAMSGFGSTILALSLGVCLYPIDLLLPVLVPLDLLVNLYIVTRHHRYIHNSLLLRKILPAMGFGLVLGIIIFHLIQGGILKKIFGFLVILLSARELLRLLRHEIDHNTISDIKSNIYIAGAGLIHGIYASGGPLLIYALGRLNLTKSAFRSTLGAVWLIFSVILTTSYIVAGTFTLHSLEYIAILLPVIITGIWLGEWLHHHINEASFKIFVFAVLLLAGVSIVIN